MKGVATFIAEAFGYALFSDSITRDLVLGVIELQQTAFLSLIIPYRNITKKFHLDSPALCILFFS
jgi:hypothetical protein